MNFIESILDLWNAGAHWIAEGLMSAGRGVSQFYARLRARFGNLLIATRDTILNFWNLTRQSITVAQNVMRNRFYPVGDVPIIPGLPSSQRFRVQGVVKIRSSIISDTGKPLQTKLPFSQDTPDEPLIERIKQAILDAILNPEPLDKPRSPKGEVARQTVRYIDDTDEAPEYDIAPLFVWRTH